MELGETDLESVTDGRGLVALDWNCHQATVAWLSETAEGRAKMRSRLAYEWRDWGISRWGSMRGL